MPHGATTYSYVYKNEYYNHQCESHIFCILNCGVERLHCSQCIHNTHLQFGISPITDGVASIKALMLDFITCHV